MLLFRWHLRQTITKKNNTLKFGPLWHVSEGYCLFHCESARLSSVFIIKLIPAITQNLQLSCSHYQFYHNLKSLSEGKFLAHLTFGTTLSLKEFNIFPAGRYLATTYTLPSELLALAMPSSFESFHITWVKWPVPAWCPPLLKSYRST